MISLANLRYRITPNGYGITSLTDHQPRITVTEKKENRRSLRVRTTSLACMTAA